MINEDRHLTAPERRADDAAEPPAYDTPRVDDLGSIRKLTLGGMNVGSDGFFGGGS
jgi:hypothetical protein